MPDNFSFIIPDVLAGSAEPGRYSDLRSDLSGLTRQGIGAVVSLTERGLDAGALRDFGFRYLHLPMVDFSPPTRGQVRDFVDFVEACRADGVAVVVHCGAGIGRTGTMLACYLVARGEPAAGAIAKVRMARPGSIETMEQERSVLDFQRTARKKSNGDNLNNKQGRAGTPSKKKG